MNPLFNLIWEPWEEEFLASAYKDMPVRLIAEKLERSESAIHTRARKLGLYKLQGVNERRERVKALKSMRPLPSSKIRELSLDHAGTIEFARAIERAHGIK